MITTDDSDSDIVIVLMMQVGNSSGEYDNDTGMRTAKELSVNDYDMSMALMEVYIPSKSSAAATRSDIVL